MFEQTAFDASSQGHDVLEVACVKANPAWQIG